MARPVGSSPWERGSGRNAQKCVGDSVSIRNALTTSLTDIVTNVELSDNFWTLLLQRGVVNEDTMRKIQANKTKTIQAQSLMLHMMEVEVYKFHGFIWALVNTHQCHLAERLGFAVRDYLDEEVYLKSSALLCPACHEFYTKAYILKGCGHYICAPCVKGAQFLCKDNQKEDVTCPVPECGKVTEASPGDGNIGLEEDDNFSILCQAVQKGTTKEPVRTAEGKSTTKTEEEEEMATTCCNDEQGMSASGRDEAEKMATYGSEEDVCGLLRRGSWELEFRMQDLENYRGILAKYDQRVEDYITDTVDKAKENIDAWATETLGWYSGLRQQVEKNLLKSVKWQKVASELSILMKARPGYLDDHLRGIVNLPTETVIDAGKKLISKLEAGRPIPILFTGFPYTSHPTSNPPVKAKFLLAHGLKDSADCRKVAWMPDGSLMVLTDTSLRRLDLNIDTAKCTLKSIQKTTATDISVAADGTRILCLRDEGIIEIKYPGFEKVKQWKPEGVNRPWNVFINNKNIYVGECDSRIIKSYNRELELVDQYDKRKYVANGNIHVTEKGKLLVGSYTGSNSRVFTIDMQTKRTSSFGSRHDEGGYLVKPRGVCTDNEDDYILVCDSFSRRVSVFTNDGQFIHHLDMDKYILHPYTIAVLSQRGKPSLMALNGQILQKKVVGVYRLE